MAQIIVLVLVCFVFIAVAGIGFRQIRDFMQDKDNPAIAEVKQSKFIIGMILLFIGVFGLVTIVLSPPFVQSMAMITQMVQNSQSSSASASEIIP